MDTYLQFICLKTRKMLYRKKTISFLTEASCTRKCSYTHKIQARNVVKKLNQNLLNATSYGHTSLGNKSKTFLSCLLRHKTGTIPVLFFSEYSNMKLLFIFLIGVLVLAVLTEVAESAPEPDPEPEADPKPDPDAEPFFFPFWGWGWRRRRFWG